MIQFKTLRYKNILSTGNVFTEIQLDRSPNTIVVGENGAGKSTFIDALCFGLFNRPFRDINKKQIVNSINKKGLVVEVEFRVGGQEYKVVRGIKPNIFEIYQNGDMLNQSATVRDYQSILEETILKLNYKSFTQIVVLGNASFTPFMQLKTSDRRIIIEDLLDIQIFSNMNLLLKERIATNKNRILELEVEIDKNDHKIEVQKEYIEKMNADVNKQIKEIITEQKGYLLKYEVAESEVLNLTTQVDELLSKVEHEQKVKAKEQKISTLLHKLHDKHHKSEKKATFFENNDHCPTCEQIIEVAMKQQKLTETRDSIRETEGAIEQLVVEQKKVEEEIDTIQKLQTEINTKQISIRESQSTMKHMKENGKSANTRIRTLQTKQVKDHSVKDKIKELEEIADKYKSEREDLSVEKNLLTYASEMLNDGGIKKRIIKQYVPIMNKLINKYLASMEFFVNFELDEEFNEVIKSRFRDVFSYSNFSEGEKMRIDLALLFTWRAIAKMKNSTNTNLLVLDEVFDSSLDGSGTDEFMKLIHDLGADTNVFVISHKGDTLIDKFRSKLEFGKIKNFSRIV